MSANIASDSKVTMICPNLSCRRTLNAPPTARGQLMRCAYCNAPFRVPKDVTSRPDAAQTASEDKSG